MDSNTHSTRLPGPPGLLQHPEPPGPWGPPEHLARPTESPVGPEGSAGWPESPARLDGLGFLAAADEALAAEDLDGLTDTALAEQTLGQLLDCLEGQWLRRLAAVEARGAAGADQGQKAASTAGWLRDRLRMGSMVARPTWPPSPWCAEPITGRSMRAVGS